MQRLDIGTVAWLEMNEELGITYPQLNDSFAANTAGLAIGCVFLIPVALKYGRRPVYIVSMAISFAMAIWQAKFHTFGELLATQVISGIAGAVSETLVQMTV
jgi:MFS family permease